MKLAAMPWFPADFFADTEHVCDDAAKAYLFLLGHAWIRGARLPNDDAALARMARVSIKKWVAIRDAVMSFWKLCEDGFWRQQRMSKEYEFVSRRAEANRKNGSLGGQRQTGKN